MRKKTKKQSVKIDIVKSLRKLGAFSEFIRKLETDIRKDDRLAVIIFCAGVESVLDFLVEELFKYGSEFSKLSFPNKVKLLNEFGVIDDKIFNNLLNLRKLRNTAAHTPHERLGWKNKFSYNKNSSVYKETVKIFGKPKNLFEHLYCVWNTFFLVATEYIAKWKFARIVDTLKVEQNNK
jgi:hypothetical protein